MSAYNPNRGKKLKLSQVVGLTAVGVFVVGAAAAYALMTTNTYFGSQASSDRDKCPADSFVARVVEKDGTNRKVCKCKNGRVVAFGSGAKCTATQIQPGGNTVPGATGSGTGPAQVIDGSTGTPRGIFGGSGEGDNKRGIEAGGGTKQINGATQMPSGSTGFGVRPTSAPMIIDPIEKR